MSIPLSRGGKEMWLCAFKIPAQQVVKGMGPFHRPPLGGMDEARLPPTTLSEFPEPPLHYLQYPSSY